MSLYMGKTRALSAEELTVNPALSTIPALLYTFIETIVLHMNTAVLGARYAISALYGATYHNPNLVSIWVFTLLAMEAMKTHKTNPHFMIGENKIPTWTTPLVLVLFISFIVPNTSFLGHLCGLLFGYGCKSCLLPELTSS